MDKPRIGQKKEQAVKNTGHNDVEVTTDDVTHLKQESGGAAPDRDSNLSAAAGNPNGRGAGKDPSPLMGGDDLHESKGQKAENQERLVKERGSVPDTGARRGDVDAPIADRGGTYSPSNNGHQVTGKDQTQPEHTRHDGVRRGDH